MRALQGAIRTVLLVSAFLLHGFASPASAAPLTKSGELIVKFRPGTSQGLINSILADMQATPIHRFDRIQAEHERIAGAMSVSEAILRYKDHPAIQFIEPNYIVSINRTPDDPRFPELWALRNTGQTGGLPGADISATEAWDTSTGSPNVIVGVIDTGIDYTHPDLAANIYTNAAETPDNGIDDDGNGFIDDVRGWDFVNHDNNPMDDHGHGTHVAGTVGAVGNNGIGVTGVNWSVRLMPLKFLSSGGSGSTADAIAAIEYATQMGVDIMSNSWGGGDFSEALRLAIVDASNAGIFFVAAAGNSGSNNDISPSYPASYDVPNVISVAATDHLDQLAAFSSYGATSVDLAAPGVDILSTFPSGSYGVISGTSMATPHVSGVLALILAQYPAITLPAGKALLLNSVDRLPDLDARMVSGGRLNAARALEGPDSIAPNPVFDLAALAAASNSIPLQWTATGDDGMTGTVTDYDIRYATFEITEGNFDSATPFASALELHPPGDQEQVVVTGLSFSTTYHFAIQALDEYGNRSPLSNVVSATTLGPPDIDLSPASLSAALLTGGTVSQTLTLMNPSAGTLDFSLNIASSAPDSVSAPGGPQPSGIPGGGSGALQWSDYVQAAATNPPTAPPHPAGVVRTATLPSVITDPSGDGGTVDITVLRGLGDFGQLQIEMEFSTVVDPFNFGGFLSLDIDQDRATGIPPSAGNGLQDIGAEYEFQFFSLGSGVVNLVDVFGNFVGSFPVEIGVRSLRFSAPLALIGNDDGAMDVTGVIGTSGGPTDWFPNSGHGSILALQWLSVEPSMGTVPPGGSVNVQVTFDASGLFGGGYDASIRVTSNDPDEAEVLVPAHLDVTGAPDIALSSLAVDYGTVFLGVSLPRTITVTNDGTDLLTVTGVTASPGAFTVAPDGFSLAPGESHDVIVTFSPLSAAVIDGLLTIASNDHDEGVVTVTLHGEGLVPPDIGVEPSMFAESLTTGETATTVMTVHNTGGSNLTFGVRTTRDAVAEAVGSPVSVPSSLRGPTLNQTGPGVGPPSVRAEYEGTFLRLGITAFGEIMPFQSPVGNEHLAVGTFLAGYTVAYVSGGIDRVCYSVNSDRSGIDSVSYRELENTPSRVSVEVVTRTFDGVLGIRRLFTFLRERKYVEVTTELQNLSASPVTQVVFKEDVDWDVDNDYADDAWDYDRSRNMVVAWDQHYVAVAAGQAPDLMDIYGWNDVSVRTTTVDVPTGPVFNYDGLEVLHFELGTLGPSQRRPVSLAYGVGSTLEDLQRVMDRAIGVSWLSVNPDTGVVPPGGSADLALTFNPGVLPTGDYTGQVVVESNDPDESEVTLPASLHVTGIPNLAVSADSLDFGSPFLGQVVTRTLQVTNIGTGQLEVTSITPGLPEYTVDPAAFALEPLESRDVTLTFSTTTAGLKNSTLTIASNDPDEGVVTVTLHGEGLIPPDIGVEPPSLSADLLTGETATRLLTIRNTGGSNLNFTVAPRAAAPGETTVVALRTPGQESALLASVAATSASVWTEMAASRAATGVPDARAAAVASPVLQNSIVAGNEILVLANSPIDASVLRALNELGQTYDQIFTSEFTGIDFTPYHTVVVAMTGGLISEASCQALANAAAGGRLLFMVGGTNYLPYYNGVQTYLLSHTGEEGWVTSAAPHLSVVNASDPLAAGLPPTHTFADFSTSYYMLRINDSAARVAVRNGDNHPALVHKRIGAGTLVYYLNPPENFYWRVSSDFAVLKQIVQNALTLGGVPWLSVEPGAGTVPPGGSVDVQVTFDATGLFGGGYDASVRVESNDPDEAEVLVPAHLDVTGAPDITLSSLAVDYGTVFLGVSLPQTITVTNDGTDLLTVTSVTASPGDFSAAPDGFSLAPGESHDVIVTFSPLSAAVIDGSLTIASNDPDEGVVTVTLHGEGLIPPDIGVEPPSLSADLLTGETATRLLTIRNTGGSNLNFTVAPQAAAPEETTVVALRTPGQESALLASVAAASASVWTETATSRAATAVLDARAAAVASPALQNSIVAGNDILVLTTTFIDTSVLRALNELGQTYDLIFTNEFTGIDFTPYRTVVVAMDGGTISETSCQALANAAAGGRLLYMVGGTNYPPYYNGMQTYLLSHTGEEGWTTSATPHLSVVDASDPLAAGLPPTYTFTNYYASYYMLRINDPAARVAVRNGDNHPALVHKPIGAGTLVYFTSSAFGSYWSDSPDFAILKQITQNTLQFGATRWLSVEPRAGTVPPGGSVDVQVTFDATGLFGGGYDASIRVSSNDPDEAEVLVPAHLDVTGVPDITLSSVAVDYGTVFLGVSRSETVTVTNDGTDLLTVTGVTASPGDFSAAPGGFSLAPGESLDVIVTFSPLSAAAIDGLLTIASNDHDEGVVTVTLHGEGLVPPDIGVEPASLSADLLPGETESRLLTIRNTGGSNLAFEVRTARAAVAGAVGSPVSVPSSLRGPTLNQTGPDVGPPSVRAGYEGTHLRFGITGFGEIMPFQSPVGNEHLMIGSFLAGYTVAYVSGGVDRACYSVNSSRFGIEPVSYRELENTPTRVSVEVVTRTFDGVLGIRRVFTFPRAKKFVEVTTELQNLSVGPVTQVVFKEDVDWDVDASVEGDGWDYDRSRNMVYAWDQRYVAVAAGLAPDLMDIFGWNDYTTRTTTVDIPSGPVFNFDGLEVLHFELGTLGPSQKRPVSLAYGVGSTLAELQQVMDNAIGVSWLSVNPDTGVVPPGGSADLAVTFDATGIDPDRYAAVLEIASNDPVTPVKEIPVTLHVVGVPIFSVQPTLLEFAPHFVGQTSSQTLLVENTGTDVLSVTGISSDEGSYSASPTSFDLAVGASQIVTVTFAPLSLGTKNGTLSIAHNAEGSPSLIPMAGSAVEPPTLTYSPDSIRVSLNPGTVGTEIVTIGNVGGSDLHFSLEARSVGLPVSVSTDPPLAKGEEDTRVGSPVVLRSGGPDQFGHRWIDSDSPGGPVFNWLNIAPRGAVIPLLGDDLTSAPIPIGFPFRYFGTEFTSVRVSTNGYLSFTSALASYSNQPLPSTAAPENLLAVFWDDLYFDGFSHALYYNDGGRFIVQFDNVHRVGGGGPYTFEVILYPSGAIVYQYLSMSPSLTSATIGIQNADRNDGLTVVFDNSYVHNNLAIRIETGLSWLTLNPADGAVPVGGALDVRAFLNTRGLTPGDQAGVIGIYTNDPLAMVRTIPVTLHVNGDDPPVVTAPATATGAEGAPLTVGVTAVDPEGDVMYSLTAAPLPAGATFVANATNTAGELHWTPDYDQAGSHMVTISAVSARHAHPVSGPLDPLEGSAIVTISIANTDRAPVVTAPATQTVAEGTLLTFIVTAADPDGDPVATVEVGELPVGATYTPDPGVPRGTFTWTPTFASAGNYTVTFTATNVLSGSATTAITVTDQNRAPIANAGGPYTGMTGVPIAFDGSRSTDPDGEDLEFTWNFGDGDSGSGPTPTHTYTSMAGSPFTVALTVSDGTLSNTATTTATVQTTVAANVFFALNLNYIFPQILPAWVRIEPIAGSFGIQDVVLSSVTMSYGGMSILSKCKSVVDGDRNHNGVKEARICFARNDLKTLFASLPNGTSDVEITLEGSLMSGGSFRGSTMAHVIKFSFLGSGALAQVSPNPLNPQATLTFVTTEPGQASAQLFDLHGRLVRDLLPRQYFMPGAHQVMIDGRNDQGSRLASGVYYYRVQSVTGVSKGAITVLK